MAPLLASMILIVEATIALGVLLAVPAALGYGAYAVVQRRSERG